MQAHAKIAHVTVPLLESSKLFAICQGAALSVSLSPDGQDAVLLGRGLRVSRLAGSSEMHSLQKSPELTT